MAFSDLGSDTDIELTLSGMISGSVDAEFFGNKQEDVLTLAVSLNHPLKPQLILKDQALKNLLGDRNSTQKDVAGLPYGDRKLDKTVDMDDVEVRLSSQLFEIAVTLVGEDEMIVDFDSGLKGLPLEAEGGVRLVLGFKADLGVGVRRNEGFYFLLNELADDAEFGVINDAVASEPEFALYFDAGLLVDTSETKPVPTSLSAKLFGLKISATDVIDKKTAQPGTRLSAKVSLDVTEPADTPVDGHLLFSEITSNPFLETFVPDLTDITGKQDAGLFIDLRLEAGINDNLPSVQADLKAQFTVGLETTDDGLKFVPTGWAKFEDVGINLGDFLGKHIGKVVDEVDKLIEPLKPLIKFLKKKVPGVSQLSEAAGKGEVTFLDLGLRQIDDVAKRKAARKFVDTLDTIITISDTLKSNDENILVILVEEKYLLGSPPAGGNSGGQTVGSGQSTSVTQGVDNVKGKLKGLLQKLDDIGVTIDLIDDTSNIINLLTGQEFNIVSWDIPKFEFPFNWEKEFKVIPVPPINVRLGLDAAVFVDLSVGFDSRGLTTGNFFDGFYFGDRENVFEGDDIDELGLTLGVRLAAMLDLLVASAGIEGELRAGIFADWNVLDQESGKFHLDEIKQVIEQDGVDCLFNINGELRAIVRVIWEVFGKEGGKEFFNKVLFDFDTSSNCPKIELGEVVEAGENISLPSSIPAGVRQEFEQEGTLVLYAGSFANRRRPGVTSDTREEFTVTQQAPGVYQVEALGLVRKYSGAKRIFFDGGNFDDKLLLVGVDVPVVALGGSGNDELEGTKRIDYFDGGPGNDIIVAYGGGDTIFAGSGNDTIYGDVDKRTPTMPVTKGSAGADVIDGGGGNDNIFGDGGDDTIYAGAGNDTIFGDGGDDTIYAGTGNDVVRAGADNDMVYGQAGKDQLFGENGDDTIFGQSGRDLILRGAGNDLLRGGSGSDLVSGGTDTGARVPFASWTFGTSDRVYGGAGNDLVLGGSPTSHASHPSPSNPPDPPTTPHEDNKTLTDLETLVADMFKATFGFQGKENFEFINYLDKQDIDDANDTDHTDGTDGTYGDDDLWGGTGNDLLLGDEGQDFLFGGWGNDALIAHQIMKDSATTNDRLEGGPDDDFICGTDGVNETYGGTSDLNLQRILAQDPGTAPLGGGFTIASCTDTPVFNPPPPAQLRGVKFEDLNGNGVQDSGEPGLNGWTIELYDDQNELITSVVTRDNFEAVVAAAELPVAPTGIAVAPDGNLYVADAGGTIRFFDSTTGEELGTAVSVAGATIQDLAFDADGLLYFVDQTTASVMRADTAPALFTSGFTLIAPTGLTFGPGDDLYVASSGIDQVVRYNGQTGDYISVFASGSEMDDPRGLAFGPDGDLYVVSAANDQVARYDGANGAFKDVFTALGGRLADPVDLAYIPADDVWAVSSASKDAIKVYDAQSGAYLRDLQAPPGLNAPTWLDIDPLGNVYVSSLTAIQMGRNLDDGQSGSGFYTINDLEPGTFTVKEVLNSDFTQTVPAAGGSLQVTLAEGQFADRLDFGNIGSAQIHGTKWQDLDGDSRRDAGERGQAGVPIFLQRIADSTDDPLPITDLTTTTAEQFVYLPGQIADIDVRLDISHANNADLTAVLTSLAGTSVTLFTGADVNVTLDISHTNDADLRAFLVSPAGTRVELFTGAGGTGDNFTGTTLDDEAGTPIGSGTAPFTGSFQPIGSLVDFDNEDAFGTWVLEITDSTDNSFEGTLNSWSIDYSLVTPVTFDSSDGPLTIADPTTARSELTVDVPGTIADIDIISLDITHPNVADLEAFLVSPTGLRVDLFSGLSAGANFVGTTLDDAAAALITGGAAPFTGSFQPTGSLSDFNGQQAAGRWTLEVSDRTLGDTGTLDDWGLKFTLDNVQTWGLDNVVVTLQTGSHLVDLARGDVVEGLDFANHPLPGEIRGTKSIDPDGDGQGDQVPQVPWDIFLDINGNGVQDNYLVASESLATPLLIADAVAIDLRSDPPSFDPVTTTTEMFVNQAGSIVDVDVLLDITHANDEDLSAVLVGPDGTRVELFSAVGGADNHFTNTILDDKAAVAINDASARAPFTGRFKPTGMLSMFDGKDPTGTWTLELTDSSTGVKGTLNQWTLSLTLAEPLTSTDVTGAYEFMNLPAGAYTVQEVQQSGFAQTAPDIPIGLLALGTAGRLYDVDVATGGSANARNTALTEAPGITTGANGMLYAITDSNSSKRPNSLYLIDPVSGQSSLVGTIGIGGSTVPPMTISEGDLDFDPTSGLLYAVGSITSGPLAQRLAT